MYAIRSYYDDGDRLGVEGQLDEPAGRGVRREQRPVARLARHLDAGAEQDPVVGRYVQPRELYVGRRLERDGGG